MELRQLKYFVTVAETLNFSRAAEKLYITQGTLSQQIKQLEGELGSDLFIRTPHSVAMTEAGEELLPLARKTLEDSEACQLRLSDLRKALTGTLNIGVTHSTAGLVTPTVRVFLKDHPGVKLNIITLTATGLLTRLSEGLLDLIVCFKPAVAYEGVESTPMLNCKLEAIMRKDHPLADRPSVSFEDISRYGVIIPESSLQARKAFDRFVNVDTSMIDVRMQLNEPLFIMDLVEHSSMVSILSTLAIHYNHALTSVPIEGIDRTMTVCVHTLRNSYRKRSADIFTQMLLDS